jgi:predicted MFS family arabinose efflux permease
MAATNATNRPANVNADFEDVLLRPAAALTAPSFVRSTLIRLRFQPIADSGPPPDGGIMAWSQVLGAHFTVCNTWGYVTTFGMFQSHYEQILPLSASSISWIGGIQVFLLFFVGTFSGRAADAGFFRPIWALGAVLTLFGIFMTSFCHQFWQFFLAQGVCMGLGSGLMFCPVLSLMPTYFARHRALAVGFAATGSAVGGLIFPAVFEQLLPQIGFPWTVRALGLLTLAMLSLSFILLRQRVPPRKSSRIVDWKAFQEPAYFTFAVGMFFNFWGLYIAFFYITTFARQVTGLSQESSTYLLLILNGVGLFARTVPNFLADRFAGPINLLIPSTLLSGVLLLCWISITTEPKLYTFTVFYGIFSAAVQALFPASLASLTSDMKKIGVRMGMVLSIVSFAALTGSPIAGALVSRGNGGYLFAQVFAGVSMFVGTGLLVIARVSKAGFSFMVKV